MLNKIFIAFIILAPSALYLSMASSGDEKSTEMHTAPAVTPPPPTHQTPDH
jgi:hypothetical protein